MNTKRICCILLIVLSIGAIFADEAECTLIEHAVDRFYDEMRTRVPSGDAVSIAKASGKSQERFSHILAERITRDGVYRLIDRENLPTLFKENLSQQDRAFDNESAPKMGVFTPAKWMILGSVDSKTSMRMLKRFYSVEVNLSIDRIETGEVAHTVHFSLYQVQRPPFWFFLVNLGVTLLLLMILNRATKGYYAGWLSMGFLLENVLFIVWQFFL